MNVLLFEPADLLDEQHIRITDRRLTHLQSILKVSTGSQLRIGALNGELGEGVVQSITADEAIVRIRLTHKPPPKLPVTLILALPRPKMLRRILRSVAEYGVRELHLINSYKVEKSFWQTPVLQPANLQHFLQLGLEQAVDTVLPDVILHKRFRPWVEDVLPDMLGSRQGVLAHPGDFPLIPPALTGDIALVVGPEGGFTTFEVERLQTAGCVTVSMGARILRVENAVSTLLGRVQ